MRSRVMDKKFQKTQVSLEEVNEPAAVSIFNNNYKVERVNLTKTTNEHFCYVRKCDYFDLSINHRDELEGLGGLPPTSGAMSQISDTHILSTPPIHKFCYDRDVVDIGFATTNDAYRPRYDKPYTTQTQRQDPPTYSTVQGRDFNGPT
jgi:hypothetical protein